VRISFRSTSLNVRRVAVCHASIQLDLLRQQSVHGSAQFEQLVDRLFPAGRR
jgi:hypothetical protein